MALSFILLEGFQYGATLIIITFSLLDENFIKVFTQFALQMLYQLYIIQYRFKIWREGRETKVFFSHPLYVEQLLSVSPKGQSVWAYMIAGLTLRCRAKQAGCDHQEMAVSARVHEPRDFMMAQMRF